MKTNMKTKNNKNFVTLIKKFIWQYRTKYFVESTTFVFSAEKSTFVTKLDK